MSEQEQESGEHPCHHYTESVLAALRVALFAAALFVLYFTTCLILQAVCLRIQDIISLAKTCCTAAAELHRAGFVHRDFRLSNVVMTRRDEGSYTVIDMEHAERAGQKWPLKLLQDWDENTLDKVTTQNSSVLQSVE